MKVLESLWLEKKKRKENAKWEDWVGSDCPLPRTVQMQLENGRFPTSRRSCCPHCIDDLWVPFHCMLQVLKVPVEPGVSQETRKVASVCLRIVVLKHFLLVAARRTQGWKGYGLTRRGLSCVRRKEGLQKCPVCSIWHHVGGAGIAEVLWWAQETHTKKPNSHHCCCC